MLRRRLTLEDPDLSDLCSPTGEAIYPQLPSTFPTLTSLYFQLSLQVSLRTRAARRKTPGPLAAGRRRRQDRVPRPWRVRVFHRPTTTVAPSSFAWRRGRRRVARMPSTNLFTCSATYESRAAPTHLHRPGPVVHEVFISR